MMPENLPDVYPSRLLRLNSVEPCIFSDGRSFCFVFLLVAVLLFFVRSMAYFFLLIWTEAGSEFFNSIGIFKEISQ
jgi:hypothetical protein